MATWSHSHGLVGSLHGRWKVWQLVTRRINLSPPVRAYSLSKYLEQNWGGSTPPLSKPPENNTSVCQNKLEPQDHLVHHDHSSSQDHSLSHNSVPPHSPIPPQDRTPPLDPSSAHNVPTKPIRNRPTLSVIPPPPSALVRRVLPFVQPTAPKIGKIALVGPANSGKSTLLNRLIGQLVSITSSKAQTTRDRIVGILTEAATQIIFYDTPGLAPPVVKLDRPLAVAPWTAIQDAEHVLFLWDCSHPSSYPTARHHLTHLKDKGIPVYLIINKVDKLHQSPTALAQMNDQRKALLDEFHCIQRSMVISALHWTGVKELKVGASRTPNTLILITPYMYILVMDPWLGRTWTLALLLGTNVSLV